jgi:hypothetical protein
MSYPRITLEIEDIAGIYRFMSRKFIIRAIGTGQ